MRSARGAGITEMSETQYLEAVSESLKLLIAATAPEKQAKPKKKKKAGAKEKGGEEGNDDNGENDKNATAELDRTPPQWLLKSGSLLVELIRELALLAHVGHDKDEPKKGGAMGRWGAVKKAIARKPAWARAHDADVGAAFRPVLGGLVDNV